MTYKTGNAFLGQEKYWLELAVVEEWFRCPQIFRVLLGERPWAGYCHVKVNAEEGFRVMEWVESRFVMDDPLLPLLVVRHRYGGSEQEHVHVQGILQSSITRKEVHATYEEHPAKRRKGKGSKRRQTKGQTKGQRRKAKGYVLAAHKMKVNHYDGPHVQVISC